MRLKTLFFDVDGTLADTEAEGHLPAYNAAFAEFGLDWRWTPESYQQLLDVAGGRARLERYIARFDPALAERCQGFAADPAGWISALHQAKCRYFARRLSAGAVEPRPGVARLIGQAGRAGIPFMLVSNASAASLDAIVEHVLPSELARYSLGRICGDDADRKKPAPEVYEAACRHADCRPHEALAIEDSEVGVAAAHAAGVPVIATHNSATARGRFDGAIAVLDGLGEPHAPVTIDRAPGPGFDYVDIEIARHIHASARESWF